MDDYNGRYHPYGPYNWVWLIQKYSRTKLLQRCPADFDDAGTLDWNGDPTAPKGKTDYWKNVYTDYWSGYLYHTIPPLEGVIVYKRTTVYIMDGPPGGYGHHTWWGPPTTWETARICYNSERRHSGGANVLFCDWHVSLVRPGQFKSDRASSTIAGNPLLSLDYEPYPGIRPPESSPWLRRNDGSHPWFRGD